MAFISILEYGTRRCCMIFALILISLRGFREIFFRKWRLLNNKLIWRRNIFFGLHFAVRWLGEQTSFAVKCGEPLNLFFISKGTLKTSDLQSFRKEFSIFVISFAFRDEWWWEYLLICLLLCNSQFSCLWLILMKMSNIFS